MGMPVLEVLEVEGGTVYVRGPDMLDGPPYSTSIHTSGTNVDAPALVPAGPVYPT